MGSSRVILIAALLLMLMSNAASVDKVDDHVEAEMARQDIPGLSLAVVRAGEIAKYPDEKLTVIMPSNGFRADMERIADGIMGLHCRNPRDIRSGV